MKRFRNVTYEVEVTLKELRDNLRNEPVEEYESIIRGLCLLGDTDPEIGEEHDTKEAAMMGFEPMCEIRKVEGRVGSLYILKCTFVEEYEVDENGDFEDNVGFWSGTENEEDVVTSEELTELKTDLFL